MVQARMPAKISPAMSAAPTLCLLSTVAISRTMVSDADAVSSGATVPFAVSALPIIPIRMATPMAMTTQIEAMRRETLTLFLSSIAIKRRRMWGIPK